MSSIYFSTMEHKAAVSGAERALMGVLCSSMAIAGLGSFKYNNTKLEWFLSMLPSEHYLNHQPYNIIDESIRLFLSQGFDDIPLTLSTGDKVGIFPTMLNTAILLGSDAVKLAARLHGQCEIHCYIEEANKEWVKGLIEDSLACKIFREGLGWEKPRYDHYVSVLDLLSMKDTGPVVCHYSVTDSFPNSALVEMEEEVFDQLSDDERWDLCLQELRKQSAGLEISPADWGGFRYSPGYTFFDLRQLHVCSGQEVKEEAV